MSAQTGRDLTSIKVSPDTRDQVRALKRGHMTYDELLTEMVEQFDPSEMSVVGE